MRQDTKMILQNFLQKRKLKLISIEDEVKKAELEFNKAKIAAEKQREYWNTFYAFKKNVLERENIPISDVAFYLQENEDQTLTISLEPFAEPYVRPLPYVYELTHKDTGQFYFGVRYANYVCAEKDLGFHYFSSSKNISKIGFENFNRRIVQVFENKDEAEDQEELLIKQSWGNPLLLNRHFRDMFKMREAIHKLRLIEDEDAYIEAIHIIKEKFNVNGFNEEDGLLSFNQSRFLRSEIMKSPMFIMHELTKFYKDKETCLSPENLELITSTQFLKETGRTDLNDDFLREATSYGSSNHLTRACTLFCELLNLKGHIKENENGQRRIFPRVLFELKMKEYEDAEYWAYIENAKFDAQLVCPHCGKRGRGGNFTRGHFDKCKQKIVVNET